MKKIISTLLLSTICLSSYAKNISNNNDVITIKLSHVVNEKTPKGEASEKFKEIMENTFPGRIKVEIYPDNKLFKDKQEIEALELGIIQIILPTLGKVADQYNVKEFGIFDLPFLFYNDDDVTKYINSTTGQKLIKMINEHNPEVEGIAIWPNAFRYFSGPIAFKKPNDFKNYVFRVESASMKNFYDTLGVKETIQLSFMDLPNALSKKGEYKIDGAENPLSNFYRAKLYESQKVVTLSGHSYSGYLFLVNSHWYNNLPKDIKIGLINAAKEAGQYGMDLALSNEKKLLKDIESHNVKIYQWTPEEKKRFKIAAIPVHEKFMKEVNKNFLLETYKAVK